MLGLQRVLQCIYCEPEAGFLPCSELHQKAFQICCPHLHSAVAECLEAPVEC